VIILVSVLDQETILTPILLESNPTQTLVVLVLTIMVIDRRQFLMATEEGFEKPLISQASIEQIYQIYRAL